MNDPGDAQRQLEEIRKLRAEGSISPQEAYARHRSISEGPGARQAAPDAAEPPVSATPSPSSAVFAARNTFSFDGADGVNGRLLFEGPERLSRLLLFVKFLGFIPLVLWLVIYRAAALVVTFIAFWAILFSGRYPPGLFGFVRGYVSSHYRVYSYFPLLLSDGWTAGENHPLKFVIEPAPQQSRLLLIFTKLPAMVLGVVYGIASIGTSFLMLLAVPLWFVILLTGRYPAGLRRFALSVLQWSARVTAWQFLMSDDWRMFGSSLKVRIPSIVAAYAFPAFWMWLTFFSPPIELAGGLFGVDEGMAVVDAFMQAGRDGDTFTATRLVDSRSVSDAQIAAQLQRRDLFDGYERATLKRWFRQAGTAGDVLQLEGELRYSGGGRGTFFAFLVKRQGAWLIQGIVIQRTR